MTHSAQTWETSPRSLRAIGFDLDDTLWDESRATACAARALHSRHGGDVAFEPFLAHWRRLSTRHFDAFARGEISHLEQRRRRVREILDVVGVPADPEGIDGLCTLYQEAYEAAWTPFPDALPVLAGLRSRGFPLALVTNGDGTQQRKKLARMGLTDAFDWILISGEVGVAKPDPRIFETLLVRSGRAPGEFLFIGDRPDKDVLPARALGLEALQIDRKSPTPVPPGVIRSLTDVLALVDGIAPTPVPPS